mmetsp:Transcript_6319/g.17181  ORF Transcript_6319/g.17181 Transcript_6319/m.17181 type:complete len:228 (-) Transcript_6319:58-741(-)
MTDGMLPAFERGLQERLHHIASIIITAQALVASEHHLTVSKLCGSTSNAATCTATCHTFQHCHLQLLACQSRIIAQHALDGRHLGGGVGLDARHRTVDEKIGQFAGSWTGDDLVVGEQPLQKLHGVLMSSDHTWRWCILEKGHAQRRMMEHGCHSGGAEVGIGREGWREDVLFHGSNRHMGWIVVEMLSHSALLFTWKACWEEVEVLDAVLCVQIVDNRRCDSCELW